MALRIGLADKIAQSCPGAVGKGKVLKAMARAQRKRGEHQTFKR